MEQKIIQRNDTDFMFKFFKHIYSNFTNTGFCPIGLSYVLCILREGIVDDQKIELGELCNLPGRNLIIRFLNQQTILLSEMKVDTAAVIIAPVSVSKKFSWFTHDINGLMTTEKIPSIEVINKWIERKTCGNLKDVLSVEDMGNISLMILHVFYFKDDWLKQFDSKKNIKITFRLSKTDFIEKEAMTRKLYCLSCCINNFTALRLPYIHGSSITFIMADEVGDFSFFSKTVYDEINKNLVMDEIKVVIPLFELDSKIDIKNILNELGIKTLENADLSEMFGEKTNNYTDVFEQKCKLKVNEEGSEAVTVTKSNIVSMGFDNVLAIDKPFLIMITDSTGELIIFCAVINDPIQTMSERVREMKEIRYPTKREERMMWGISDDRNFNW